MHRRCIKCKAIARVLFLVAVLIFIMFYGMTPMSNSRHLGFCKEIEFETFCFHLVSRTLYANMKIEQCDKILEARQ